MGCPVLGSLTVFFLYHKTYPAYLSRGDNQTLQRATPNLASAVARISLVWWWQGWGQVMLGSVRGGTHNRSACVWVDPGRCWLWLPGAYRSWWRSKLLSCLMQARSWQWMHWNRLIRKRGLQLKFYSSHHKFYKHVVISTRYSERL